MKQKYSFLFLLFINFIFSQSYHFDYFVEDSSKEISSKDDPWVRNYFYDSKNDYRLHLRHYEKSFLASLYDGKMSKSHFFYVSKKGPVLSFEYAYSFDHSKSEKSFKDINKDDVIDVIKVDSLQYKINIFKDKNRKKNKYAMNIFLEKNVVDFFEMPIEYSRSEEIIQKLKSYLCCDQKYIIRNSDVTNFKNKRVSQNEVSKFEKTDLTLVVPEKLKIEVPFWTK
jgi:hypothetical protein